METDTDKAKRRLKILFNHHGKYYGYFWLGIFITKFD
jgi:hypothetical protein